MSVEQTTTYLERQLDIARHAPPTAGSVSWQRLHEQDARRCAEIYAAVGGPWRWQRRLSWEPAQWEAQLRRGDVELWVACCDSEDVGFVELTFDEAHHAAEIGYLGLRPDFIGTGLGGQLIEWAAYRAACRSVQQLRLKTSSTDHPNALRAYRRHGFIPYERELASL